MTKRSSAHLSDDDPSPRFEEIEDKKEIELKENEKKSSEKKSEKDVEDFQTFYAVEEKGTRLKLYDYKLLPEDLLPKFNFSNNERFSTNREEKMNFSQIVREIFDIELLDSLIKLNVEKCPKQGKESKNLPKVLYGHNEGLHRSSSLYNIVIHYSNIYPYNS